MSYFRTRIGPGRRMWMGMPLWETLRKAQQRRAAWLEGLVSGATHRRALKAHASSTMSTPCSTVCSQTRTICTAGTCVVRRRSSSLDLMRTPPGALEANFRRFGSMSALSFHWQVHGPGGRYCARARLPILEVAHHWQERFSRLAARIPRAESSMQETPCKSCQIHLC